MNPLILADESRSRGFPVRVNIDRPLYGRARLAIKLPDRLNGLMVAALDSMLKQGVDKHAEARFGNRVAVDPALKRWSSNPPGKPSEDG